MCKCTPEIRTPFCGKPGCERPQLAAPAAAPLESFVRRLLDPDDFGYAVTHEVRLAARAALQASQP